MVQVYSIQANVLHIQPKKPKKKKVRVTVWKVPNIKLKVPHYDLWSLTKQREPYKNWM